MGKQTKYSERVSDVDWAEQGWEITDRKQHPDHTNDAAPPFPTEPDAMVDKSSPSVVSERSSRFKVKCGAWVIGAGVLAGVAFGLVALVDFMRTNNIEFRGGAGNTPYTASQVALHNSEQDCWVIYHGKVYDMTDYATKHPGGAKHVTGGCGSDDTVAYDLNHNEDLLKLVKGDMIGSLTEETEGDGAVDPTIPDDPDQDTNCPTGDCISLVEVALHSTTADCWVVYHDNVYDMTEYAPNHKGGVEWITNGCGTDQTTLFDRFHKERELKTVTNHWLGPILPDPSRPDEEDNSDATETPNESPVDSPVEPPTEDDDPSPTASPVVVDCPTDACVTSRELALHTEEDDCWVAYLGIVYDMTDYIPKHKGGPEFITDVCGTDDTEAFLAFHKENELKKVQDAILGTYIQLSDGDIGSPPGGQDDEATKAPTDAPVNTPECPTDICVTMEELSAHDNDGDCWAAYLGNVYDMTDYISKHKGGPEFISDACGKDDSEAFLTYHKEKELKKVANQLLGTLI